MRACGIANVLEFIREFAAIQSMPPHRPRSRAGTVTYE
jgi:hypothetical protein